MRRFLLIAALLAGLAAPLAARAGSTDGTVSLTDGSGTFTLSGRGAVIGQIDKGSVKTVDPIPGDGSGPIVTGAEHQRAISDTTSRYSGTDVSFRIIGGTFTVVVSGSGIDLSFVGHGKLTISADPRVVDDGKYSFDGGTTYQPVLPGLQTFNVGLT